MDPNDPVAVGIVATLVFAGFLGVLALIVAVRRGARTKVERSVREYATRLGLQIEVGGSFRWWVRARGVVGGRGIEMMWAVRGEYVQRPMTHVWAEIPALPADFALEVFIKGAKPTSPEYAVRSGDPSFDACFAGWTDVTALAPRLLDPAVRAALLGLRQLPGIQLSALTGKWTTEGYYHGRPPPRRVKIGIEGVCTDTGTLDGLVAGAQAFANVATATFGGAHPPVG